MSEVEKEISFKNLDNLFLGNPELYLEFLSTVINSFETTVKEVEIAYKIENDFEKISSLRHSIMPTIEIFNLNSIKHHFKEITSKNPNTTLNLDILKKQTTLAIKMIQVKISNISNE